MNGKRSEFPAQAAHMSFFSMARLSLLDVIMTKALLIIGLPAVALTVFYCVLAGIGLRRHVDRLADRCYLSWRVTGFALLIAIIFLATNAPGSTQLANALDGFLRWLHT